MNELLENVELEDEVLEDNEAKENVVRITLEGKDLTYSFEQLSVDMDSSQQEILEAVGDLIQEAEGSQDGYVDAYNDYTYTVRKAMNSNTIYVYPKPVAGI